MRKEIESNTMKKKTGFDVSLLDLQVEENCQLECCVASQQVGTFWREKYITVFYLPQRYLHNFSYLFDIIIP